MQPWKHMESYKNEEVNNQKAWYECLQIKMKKNAVKKIRWNLFTNKENGTLLSLYTNKENRVSS